MQSDQGAHSGLAVCVFQAGQGDGCEKAAGVIVEIDDSTQRVPDRLYSSRNILVAPRILYGNHVPVLIDDLRCVQIKITVSVNGSETLVSNGNAIRIFHRGHRTIENTGKLIPVGSDSIFYEAAIGRFSYKGIFRRRASQIAFESMTCPVRLDKKSAQLRHLYDLSKPERPTRCGPILIDGVTDLIA